MRCVDVHTLPIYPCEEGSGNARREEEWQTDGRYTGNGATVVWEVLGITGPIRPVHSHFGQSGTIRGDGGGSAFALGLGQPSIPFFCCVSLSSSSARAGVNLYFFLGGPRVVFFALRRTALGASASSLAHTLRRIQKRFHPQRPNGSAPSRPQERNLSISQVNELVQNTSLYNEISSNLDKSTLISSTHEINVLLSKFVASNCQPQIIIPRQQFIGQQPNSDERSGGVPTPVDLLHAPHA